MLGKTSASTTTSARSTECFAICPRQQHTCRFQGFRQAHATGEFNVSYMRAAHVNLPRSYGDRSEAQQAFFVCTQGRQTFFRRHQTAIGLGVFRHPSVAIFVTSDEGLVRDQARAPTDLLGWRCLRREEHDECTSSGVLLYFHVRGVFNAGTVANRREVEDSAWQSTSPGRQPVCHAELHAAESTTMHQNNPLSTIIVPSKPRPWGDTVVARLGFTGTGV